MKVQIICAKDGSQNFVRKLTNKLEENNPGEFDIAITESNTGLEIKKASHSEGNPDTVVACLTEESIKDESLNELRSAVKAASNITSLLLDDEKKVFPPLFIAHIQYANMNLWRGYTGSDGSIKEEWLAAQTEILKNLLMKTGKNEGKLSELQEKIKISDSNHNYLQK